VFVLSPALRDIFHAPKARSLFVLKVQLNTNQLNQLSNLPYITLPYGEDVLPPSAEASSGPNAHPLIDGNIRKSPNAVFTWVHTKIGITPSQMRAYPLGPTHYYAG